MPDETSPEIVDAVNFDLRLKPADKFTLRNGVEVYAVNAGAEEVLSLEWVFLPVIGMKNKTWLLRLLTFCFVMALQSEQHFRSMSTLNIMVLISTGLVTMKQRPSPFTASRNI